MNNTYLSLYSPIFSFTFSFSFNNNHNITLLIVSSYHPLYYQVTIREEFVMIHISRLIYFNDGLHLHEDGYNPYLFARGFDDFVASTSSPSATTTNVKDDK